MIFPNGPAFKHSPLAPVVERLVSELDPQLLTQDAMLGQVQREFCDVAVEACRSAWG